MGRGVGGASDIGPPPLFPPGGAPLITFSISRKWIFSSPNFLAISAPKLRIGEPGGGAEGLGRGGPRGQPHLARGTAASRR